MNKKKTVRKNCCRTVFLSVLLKTAAPTNPAGSVIPPFAKKKKPLMAYFYAQETVGYSVLSDLPNVLDVSGISFVLEIPQTALLRISAASTNPAGSVIPPFAKKKKPP